MIWSLFYSVLYRIAPSGRISYSQRLTVTARCQMDLRKFPLDTQVSTAARTSSGAFLKGLVNFVRIVDTPLLQSCPLEIGSFGFNSGELEYEWDSTPLSMDEALELAQYKVHAVL